MSGMEAFSERIAAVKSSQLDQLAAYRQKLYREPVLRQLFLELTLRCNARCFHCGSSCTPESMDGLPLPKLLEILEEVRENFDLQKLQLCVTGGEPLLRKDFFELMGSARQMGYHWGMTSNGTLITKEVARKLKETQMGTISISVDGLEETHDALRGMPGGYRRTMEGINNLLEVGGFHAVQVTTVINHANIGQLDRLYDIFRDMDLDSWRVIGLEPIGRARLRPDLLLTPEDQRRLFAFIREKREERMPVTYGCSHFLGLELEREVRKWYFLCNAGIYTASIMANGDIGGCLDIERRPETICGNVYKDRFTDVWRNGFSAYRQPLSDKCATCRNCPEEKWCAGGARHSWDYDNNCPQICFKGILF